MACWFGRCGLIAQALDSQAAAPLTAILYTLTAKASTPCTRSD